MKIPLSRADLADYQNDDPDAHNYRPSNVDEYKSGSKDELVMWDLRIFEIQTQASGPYLS